MTLPFVQTICAFVPFDELEIAETGGSQQHESDFTAGELKGEMSSISSIILKS